MQPDLLEVVQTGLAARKEEWREIADELGMSYEFISRLGLRTYTSSPTIGRLRRIAEHLRVRKARASQRAASAAQGARS